MHPVLTHHATSPGRLVKDNYGLQWLLENCAQANVGDVSKVRLSQAHLLSTICFLWRPLVNAGSLLLWRCPCLTQGKAKLGRSDSDRQLLGAGPSMLGAGPDIEGLEQLKALPENTRMCLIELARLAGSLNAPAATQGPKGTSSATASGNSMQVGGAAAVSAVMAALLL